ncbi:MAG: hypothetical protein APF76_02985 [Desulfitibacter sp. BRH_c19]|nr:MAG: hypothetical protein APF76_02985 [Desulfitibacter sp. BRH_c19]
MEVTLADLLLSNFLKNATVLAGEKGLSKKVTSVTVLDSPDAHQYLRGGEFVVTTAYSILDDEDMQSRVVENLAKNGAAGLGIKLRFFKNKLPERLKKKADEIGFSIISMPDEHAYIDILEFVMLNMVCNLTKEVKRIDEVYKEINKSISSEGLDGVAKILYKWTGLSIVILFEEEAYSYPAFTLPTKFSKRHEKWSPKYSKYNTAGSVNCYGWEINGETSLEWLATEIMLDNSSEGYILMFKDKEDFNKTDCIILDYAASACSMEIQRIKSLKDVKRKYKNEFLLRLMNGEYSFKDAFYQASQLDFSISQDNLIVAVLDSNNIMEHNFSIERIDNLITRVFGKNAIYGMYNNDLVILFSNYINRTDFPINKFYDELENIFGKTPYYLGIGRLINFSSVQKSYEEAKKAIKIGSLINIAPKLFHFSSLGFYRLLNLPEVNDEIRLFYNEYLIPLVEYDRNNNADLIETLSIYISCGYNYRETAKCLYVHPNTVRYRVSTIERLTQLDLKSADDRLNMQIALKIMPFITNT